MNKIQEKINEFLKGKGIKPVTLAEETSLMSMTTTEGHVINAEVFEAGAAVTIEVDGEQLPLPPATYEFEDGSVLVVEEEGIIASYEAKAAEEEEEAEAAELSAEQKEEALLTKIGELVDSKLEAFKTELSAKEETAKEAKENEEIEELKTELNKIKETPKAKPLAQETQEVNLSKKEYKKLDRMGKINARRNNITIK